MKTEFKNKKGVREENLIKQEAKGKPETSPQQQADHQGVTFHYSLTLLAV